MKLSQQIREQSGYGYVMDRTETASPYGHALLRQPRWYGPGEEEALEEELSRVEEALGMEKSRMEELSHLLSAFRDIRGSFRRTAGAAMDVVELFEVKYFLLCLDRLSLACGGEAAGVSLPDLTDLLDLLDPSGRRLALFSVEPAFAPALERIRREKKQAEEALRQTEGREREELLALRRKLTEGEDREELEARRRLTDALLRQRERIFAAMEAVGRLDLVLAKGRLARRFGCVRPEISRELSLRGEELVHPRVSAALAEEGLPFTPVSIALSQGAAVITGANMGGKSVTLKNVTVNLLLMHTGFFVFAKALCAPLLDGAELICTDGESVERGLSSFGAEVRRLDDTLRENRGKRFFLALDEFARGTNPREGAAIARGLVRHLEGEPGCIALLTTHYDGVASAARRHYRVAGLSGVGTERRMPEELHRLMDYHLLPAPPDEPCPRDAMTVCRLMGLDEKLMKALEENS